MKLQKTVFLNKTESVYWRLLNDSTKLLGNELWFLSAKGVPEENWGWPIFFAVTQDSETEKIRSIIEKYARGCVIPKRTSYNIRWTLGVRMKLASAFLYPFRKNQIHENSPIIQFFQSLSEEELIKLVLLDLMPTLRSVLEDYKALEEKITL